MPQFVVSLKAPAVVEGAVVVEAENEEEAKKIALGRSKGVIWSKSGVDESKVEVVRLFEVK